MRKRVATLWPTERGVAETFLAELGVSPVDQLSRRRSARGFLLLFAMFSICITLDGPLLAEDAHAKLEGQYQSESDPVRKAKVLAKLGRFEVADAGNRLKNGEDEKCLSILEHYRDQVRETVAALQMTRINAQQHPAGFKELQISLRDMIRDVGDIDLRLAVDRRPWFDAVRADLSASQNALFVSLFPTVAEPPERTRP